MNSGAETWAEIRIFCEMSSFSFAFSWVDLSNHPVKGAEMKKFIAASVIVLSAGISIAAVGSGRETPTALSRGTVLDPFKLQVVSANEVVAQSPQSAEGLSTFDLSNPSDITEVVEFVEVRPGPFTPPPRSPYAPPPR